MPGLFSDNVKIYHYPSIRPSKKVILILKGIYGEHVPDGNSWDNALVKLLQNDYHVVFVRTSRLNDKTDDYSVSDFLNNDHLSRRGAINFSRLLADRIHGTLAGGSNR